MNDSKSEEQRWAEYYAATETRSPREMLVKALEYVPHEGCAIDLGCGCGHDTIAMLKHGLHVTAVDASEEATARTIKQAQQLQLSQRLQTFTRPFEHVEFGTYQLINAAYSLPFCSVEAFPALWTNICEALLRGGVFSGQFFGDRDQWAHEPGHHSKVFLTRPQVDELISGLEPVHFAEDESDGLTAVGNPHHWHVYHMVLRKP